jgi:hypothetical protein
VGGEIAQGQRVLHVLSWTHPIPPLNETRARNRESNLFVSIGGIGQPKIDISRFILAQKKMIE